MRVQAQLENLGANMVASASREQMAYSVDVIRTNLAEAVEVLIDTVLNPCFHHWEVEEQVKRLEADLKQAADNPQIGLMEARFVEMKMQQSFAISIVSSSTGLA